MEIFLRRLVSGEGRICDNTSFDSPVRGSSFEKKKEHSRGLSNLILSTAPCKAKQTSLIIVVLPMLLESTSPGSSFDAAREMFRLLPSHMLPPTLFAKRSWYFRGENDIACHCSFLPDRSTPGGGLQIQSF